MITFATEFHTNLQEAVNVANKTYLVGIDTEFSAVQPNFTNPFESPETIFNKYSQSITQGTLLQIGLSMLYDDNESLNFSVFVNQKDAKISINSLRFLAKNNFNFYDYSSYSFQINYHFDQEIQFWKEIMRNEQEEWSDNFLFQGKFQDIGRRLKQDKDIEIEFEMTCANYLRMKQYTKSYYKNKFKLDFVSVLPVIYVQRDQNIWVKAKICSGYEEVVQRQQESIQFIEMDIKHIVLIFERLTLRKTQIIGFQALTDLMFLYLAITAKEFTTYDNFIKEIFTIFPNFIDVLNIIQHPSTQIILQKIASKNKKSFTDKSLHGYFSILSQEYVQAHDAAFDAFMTVKVYDLLLKQQQENIFSVKQSEKFFQVDFVKFTNVLSAYRCLNYLQEKDQIIRYGLYPVAKFDDQKQDYGIHQCIKEVPDVVVNMLHGTQVGLLYTDTPINQIDRTWIFNSKGQIRHKYLQQLGENKIINNEFARILTPRAARKLFEIIENKQQKNNMNDK